MVSNTNKPKKTRGKARAKLLPNLEGASTSVEKHLTKYIKSFKKNSKTQSIKQIRNGATIKYK